MCLAGAKLLYIGTAIIEVPTAGFMVQLNEFEGGCGRKLSRLVCIDSCWVSDDM